MTLNVTSNVTSKLPSGRYLVAGGAGFIGSHLCEKLLGDGCAVVAVDNFITGRPENVRHLLSNSNFSLVEQDLIGNLELGGGFAGAFHLASPASPVDYAKYPIETLRVGSAGSDNILQFAKAKKCRVLVASTSEIYGDPLEHPQRESYWGNVNTIGPRGCYDESKRYLEALTMAYFRVHRLQTRIVRIFNTFGPRMRTNDGRVVPNFCIQAIGGSDLTVFGDGSQTRSFCYVSDLVEGICRLFASDYHEPVNLGNPNEMTILQFAEAILKLSGSSSRIKLHPLPQDDPKRRKPDISLAKKVLDWEPKVSLDEGLKLTYQYFRDTPASALK